MSTMTSIPTTTHIVTEKLPKSIKEGILHKQRNHFKGWRSRWFALDNHFLHYYLERADMASRNSIQIESGTIVVTETNVKVSNDVSYYPFLISHPKSSMVYRLSTTSKEDRDAWVTALNNLINKTSSSPDEETEAHASSYVYSPTGSIDSIAEASCTIPSPQLESNDDDDDAYAMENPEATLTHIPPHCRDQVENTVHKLLEAASSDDSTRWSLMFNKKGVRGYSQVIDSSNSSSSSAAAICVKGVCLMPFTIPEIYDIVSNGERRIDLDSQLAVYKRLHWFSRHSGVEHLQFKAVWPTTARDFCNLTHWRLLKSGTFVTLGMSEKFPDLCPEQSGFVRANLIGGGYVLQPVPGGTLVTIVVQSDLGGTLPASICNLAAQSQPYVLLTLRTILEKTHPRSTPLPQSLVPSSTLYNDILALAKRHQKGQGHVDSESGVPAMSSRSSQAGVASTSTSSSSSVSAAGPVLTTARLTQSDFMKSCLATAAAPPRGDKISQGGTCSTDNAMEPLYPDVMRGNIPSHCAVKIETLVQHLLRDALTTDPNEWAPLSNKKEIKAYSKINGPAGAAFYVKGETFLPYTIPEIFSVYFDSENRPKLDSQMASYERLRWLSRHVGLEYIQFKGQWPTTARDSCNLTHWRLLNNGILIDIGFSDTAQPEDSNFVRAELQMGGYVFIPVAGGTRAVIVVNTSLGGSLPNSICQMASVHQPTTMHKLRCMLDDKFLRVPTRLVVSEQVSSPKEVYAQLVALAQKLQGGHVECLNPTLTLTPGEEDAVPQSSNGRGKSVLTPAGGISAAPLVSGGVYAASPPPPPTPRPSLTKRIDFLGLTLMILPLLDCACEMLLHQSVVFRHLGSYSFILTVYLVVMYYQKVSSWLLQKHLGTVCNGSSLRIGAEVYRFNIDMGRIEEYLDGLQDVSLTAAHVTVKAVGVALSEMHSMQGMVVGDALYRPPRTAGVNVSVSENNANHGGVFVHSVHDVASSVATIPTIALEMCRNKNQHGGPNYSGLRLLGRVLELFYPSCLMELFRAHFSGLVMAWDAVLGHDVCPYGAARVVSVLAKDVTSTGGSGNGGNGGVEMNEDETDLTVLPMTQTTQFCAPPVIVTLGNGGVKFVPVHHQEKKIVRKFRVINVSVSLHDVLTSSPGCTLQARLDFIARLKSLLNNPSQLRN